MSWIFKSGFAKGLAGKKIGLSDKEIEDRYKKFNEQMRNRQYNPRFPIPEDIANNYLHIVGFNISDQMTKVFETFSAKLFDQGLEDGVKRNTPKLDENQIRKVLQDFEKERFEELSAKNTKEEKEFFAKKVKEAGVVKAGTEGMMYKVITKGTGPKVTDKSNVKVHYHGTFIDGTVFDSSLKRQPFPVNMAAPQVIKGWSEILKLMKQGDKWQVYVPFKLAYGARPRPGMEPCKTLIFEMEVVEVK